MRRHDLGFVLIKGSLSKPLRKAELKRVRSVGTFDPKMIIQGALAYGLTFPSEFTAVLVGSAGPTTPGVRALVGPQCARCSKRVLPPRLC
jgi:hypothetical protein